MAAGAGARYLPAADTYLLIEALRPCAGKACLEIGFGSGAVISSVAERFELAVATDLLGVSDARLARTRGADLVLSDRARCFRDASFDLVFFNPPYVPSDEVEDRSVDGGPEGITVPLAFLEEGLRVLRSGGKIFALLSSEGNQESFLSRCEALGLVVEKVAEKRLFYETLSVFSIRKGLEDRKPHQS